MTNTEIKFKKNLKSLRESSGLSGYKTAQNMNIDRGYYYKLESLNKSQSPTYEMLEKIAEYYKIEVYELFK